MKVLIMVGSRTDVDSMKPACEMLERFGIEYEMVVSSAHRSPEKTHRLAKGAESNGFEAIICGAGMSAHLAGVVASLTTLPVIAVPLSKSLSGLDSLLSSVQMPPGVPVAVMAIDGAKNAGIFAAQILALKDKEIAKRLKSYKEGLRDG
jgi:5-(carboxyamino)imidazole ribonucleotide mutase